MFGSAPYLREEFGGKESIKIVANWMDNYEELIEKGIRNRGE